MTSVITSDWEDLSLVSDCLMYLRQMKLIESHTRRNTDTLIPEMGLEINPNSFF